jgi:ABC-2 type transport system ATP-binding protein
MAEAVVEAQGMCLAFRDFWGRPSRRVLESIDLRIEQGQVFGLLGPNGCGKSAVARLILGLLPVSAGILKVFGGDPTKPAIRARLGYLPETNIFYDFLSAEQSVDFVAKLRGASRGERRRQARSLLEFVGLDELASRKTSELSQGQRRRLSLAQALVGEPELLVLDEPTTGLDPLGQMDLVERLRSLRSQGRTVLMLSHNLADAAGLCDSAALLSQGKVLRQGPVAELQARPGCRSLIVKEREGSDTEDLRRAIYGAGATVLEDEPARLGWRELFSQTFRKTSRSSDRLQAPKRSLLFDSGEHPAATRGKKES